MIPEDDTDEAWLAIESVINYPTERRCRIRVHLAHEFDIWATIQGASIQISVEALRSESCSAQSFATRLKRMIYDTDEAIEQGRYQPAMPRSDIAVLSSNDRPDPPGDMDIPIWDPVEKTYFDAEY